ncbi:MAG: ribonuclease J, partial [Firmicutes bacterium]|nr:ribonuclease J [Bacillota bacterium]
MAYNTTNTKRTAVKPRRTTRAAAQPKPKLKVIPLGGLHEIGKNITAFEYEDEIMIIDCGVAFPEDDMPGIDLVIPDFSYLVENKDKILGVVLTHGHEDHIGSLPYFFREINVPVYGTRLTIGLVETKLREHGLMEQVERINVNAGDTITLGKNFKVEFIRSTHSIADSVAIALTTPAGVVVHSGDFKVDYTPIQGEMIDLQRFAELGKKGVLLFMCESTNVELKGYTMSESNVGSIFRQIFEESKEQRIMVATFSSNIDRIQQIINCAMEHKRKVCVVGRSMSNVVKTAIDLGYLKMDEDTMIDVTEINRYEDNRLVIITTGSQGETMSALSRVASGDHKQIEIKPGDKVIISASPIPGNEKNVYRVINELFKKGADVIYDGLMDVHVSGHARQEE